MYAEPILQVVRGDPTAEELAALLSALLAGRRTGQARQASADRSRWSSGWPPGSLASLPRPRSG